MEVGVVVKGKVTYAVTCPGVGPSILGYPLLDAIPVGEPNFLVIVPSSSGTSLQNVVYILAAMIDVPTVERWLFY